MTDKRLDKIKTSLTRGEFDWLIVGCGFSGAVIARRLAESGRRVLILEKRSHVAGNMYDEVNSDGILVHRYGPHIMHTSKQEVVDFLYHYGEWFEYQLRCGADLGGFVSPTPFNWQTIDWLYDETTAQELKKRLTKTYAPATSVAIVELLASRDELIKDYAQRLFEMDYRPYTAKQWGLEPEQVDPSILKRVPVRLSNQEAYFDDRFQLMPANGYTAFFQNLLNHHRIKLELNVDATNLLKINESRCQVYLTHFPLTIPVVWTGPIDSLWENKYGRLAYRSLKFETRTERLDSFQKYPVVAYPQAAGYTRITEYKKLTQQKIAGLTTIVYEYPLSTDDQCEPYYPLLTSDNIAAYNSYRQDAAKINNLYLCGRLADYRYYNMDEVVSKALTLSENL